MSPNVLGHHGDCCLDVLVIFEWDIGGFFVMSKLRYLFHHAFAISVLMGSAALRKPPPRFEAAVIEQRMDTLRIIRGC